MSGLQTWIGYSDVKKALVYFNVLRNSTFNTANTAIPYELEVLNIGNGFNASSGIFTVPRSGTYYFSFSSNSENTPDEYLWFSLRVNDVEVAGCRPETHISCNIPYTVQLNLGDRVQVYLIQGSANNAIFTGWLVAENVFDS